MNRMLIIDSDYTYNKLNEPVIRLFGKLLDNNEDACLHVYGFEPYIYCEAPGDINDLKRKVEIVLKGYAKRVEVVHKYKPIGYQSVKSPMLKIVLFNPKATPEVRDDLLKKHIEDIIIYEADILFNNRFLVDNEICGMDIIMFDAVELKNYGIGCQKLYICEQKDIHVLKNEMIKIEY